MSYNGLKIFVGFVCCFLLITLKSLAFNAPLDSIGIEKQGNKTFILHRVDPKETLFSLSRRYHVKVDQIQQENPELKEGLKEGQILKIPYIARRSVGAAQKNPAAKGGKTHVVTAGQTLYSISRMYNVGVADIKKWNQLSSNELSLGQEIIVNPAQSASPVQQTVQPAVEKEVVTNENANVPNFRYDSKGNKIHTTESGQTLYSISQIYNVSLEDIKRWNNLSTNEITSGQEIIIEKLRTNDAATAVEKTTEKATPSVSPVKVTNSTADSSEQTRKPHVTPEPARQPATASGFNKVINRGLAEAIEDSENNPKFLALHKTASVGTIIQVKNELNNLYIFARVIGKLPETSENDRLVVKLSKKAYDKLGAVDKRFPVEVSYVPND